MLQLGHSNKHFKYNINNLVLPNVTEVKDLGIIVDHELKFKRHIQDNTTRAHSELHLYWDVLNLKILFYCSRHLWLTCDHSWSITARCGLLAMSRQVEFVQKKFTKRLKGFSMLHYCERLNKLEAETLEMRRLKLDLVMYYNILITSPCISS